MTDKPEKKISLDYEKQSKKVSVIIPSYKGADYIRHTLESVIQQTYQNWEAIVVEDGSDDGTKFICENLTREHPDKKLFYFRHDKNQGVGPARNTAMAHATADYYAFLDCDDYWRPEYLEVMMKQIEQENADIAYSSVQWFDHVTNAKLAVWGPTEEDLASFPIGLFGRNFIAPSGAMIKKRVREVVGPFDENPLIQSCEDHDFWLRCAESRLKFTFVNQVLCWYRQNSSGQATANAVQNLERDLRILKKHRNLELIPQSEKKQSIAKIYALLAQAKRKTSRRGAFIYIFRAWTAAPLSLSNLRRVISLFNRCLFRRPEPLSF